MKVLLILFMLIFYCRASQIVSFEETETLFTKFALKNLTEEEAYTLHELFAVLRRPKYVPATQREIEYTAPSTAFARNLECLVCRSAVLSLFTGIAVGQSDKELIDTITTLCVQLGIQNENVCSGAVKLNLPIINYIIRNTPEASHRTFCALALQTSEADVCPHEDKRFKWKVDLPPVPENVPLPYIEPVPLKVAVITDTHIDPLYEAYGVANCDEPTCCRKGQRPARSNKQYEIDDKIYERGVLEIRDRKMINLSIANEIRWQRSMSKKMTKQNRKPAGFWGDYRNCDTPIWAYDDLIDRVAETHSDVDIVYYVGDTIDHGVWETSFELLKDMHRRAIEKMRSSFGENIPIFPTIGNHESQPTNQFAPSYVVGKFNTTWLYEALAEKWSPYLTPEAKVTLEERGDYSVRPRPGLKVIVINNNVAYKYNWWLSYDPLDAKKHLDWLIAELYESELAGEKVHILAHIPPGVHDLTHTWTREYNRIVNRFTSTIAAEFNGHIHSDELKVFYNSAGSPINVAWGGGSATSYSKYNLNYKIVEFDSSSLEPTSMLCFTYNVTEANLTPNRRPHWFLLYDFKNSFDVPDLSPASINKLVYDMSSDGAKLDLYAAYASKLSDARWPSCHHKCKNEYLCNTVLTVLWERQRCEELTNTLRTLQSQ